MIFRTYDDLLLPSGERVKFLRRSVFFRDTAYVRRQDGRVVRADISDAELAPCVTVMAMDAVRVAFGLEAAK